MDFQSFPPLSPMESGLKGVCPRCGKGPLFSSYLEVAPECSVCGLSYDFSDCGDGAVWFVMLVCSFIAVVVAVWIELSWSPAYWIHALFAIPLCIFLPIALLRPVKGVFVAQRYHRP